MRGWSPSSVHGFPTHTPFPCIASRPVSASTSLLPMLATGSDSVAPKGVKICASGPSIFVRFSSTSTRTGAPADNTRLRPGSFTPFATP